MIPQHGITLWSLCENASPRRRVRLCGSCSNPPPRPQAPGARGAAVADHCLAAGVLVRAAGDMMLLSPPLVVRESEVAETVDALRRALVAVG